MTAASNVLVLLVLFSRRFTWSLSDEEEISVSGTARGLERVRPLNTLTSFQAVRNFNWAEKSVWDHPMILACGAHNISCWDLNWESFCGV